MMGKILNFLSYQRQVIDLNKTWSEHIPTSSDLSPITRWLQQLLDVCDFWLIFLRCCTVNHPQGWPKFISNAFLTTPDQASLVNIYLGPFETSTTLASGYKSFFSSFGYNLTKAYLSLGNQVKAVIDTQYPFSDALSTTLTATKAFTYYVRIPSWVVGGTIAINGGAAQPVSPANGLQAVSAAAGTTKFVLNLPAPITTGMFLVDSRTIYSRLTKYF